MAVTVDKFISNQSINQSINIFNVLGGNWDPTDKRFSSVNSYRQDLLPTIRFDKHTGCMYHMMTTQPGEIAQ